MLHIFILGSYLLTFFTQADTRAEWEQHQKVYRRAKTAGHGAVETHGDAKETTHRAEWKVGRGHEKGAILRLMNWKDTARLF